MHTLYESVLYSMILLPLLRDDTAALSKFVDMREFDFVDFLILVGATDITVDAKLQESVNADGSSASDVSGGAITQISATGDNVMCIISAAKTTLTKRYAGVLVTSGNGIAGANSAAVAVRYRKAGNSVVSQESAGSNSYATAEIVRV